MNHSTLLKSIFLSLVFAFCLNTVSAQKSDKKTKKAKTEQRISQAESIDASKKEPRYKYVYSLAYITNSDGKYTVNFEERKGRSSRNEETMRRMKDLNAKMQHENNMQLSETDLMNNFADQGLELISITNFPGKEGQVMKYYFRTKVEY